MAILGKGWGKDLGLIFANSAISGVESLVGQNFYQPEIQGGLGKKINQGFDIGAQVSGAIAPMVLDAYIPGSGQAINAARGVMPKLGDAKEEQTQNNPLSIFRNGGHMFPFGGQMEQTGPNLNTFNLPTHEQGGGLIAPNAEIEKKETTDPSEKYVFSDRLKLPGTKRTFAQESKKFKGSDKDDDITKRTNKMMLDRLRNNQEELKRINYEKDKIKFEKEHGPQIQAEQQAMAEQMHQQMMMQQQMPQDPAMQQQIPGAPQGMIPPGMAPQFPGGGYIGGQGSYEDGGYYTPQELQAAYPKGKWVNIGSTYGGDSYGGPMKYHYGGGMAHAHFNTTPNTGLNTPNPYGFGTNPNPAYLKTNVVPDPGFQPSVPGYVDPYFAPLDKSFRKNDPYYGIKQPNFGVMSAPGSDDPNSPFFDTTVDNPEFKRQYPNSEKQTYPQTTPEEAAQMTDTPGKFNYSKLNEMGKYAPIAYNVYQALQPIDYYKPVYNPQYDKAIQLASDLRYNADPEIAQARRTFRNMKGAIDQYGTGSTGVKLSNLQMAGIQQNRALQEVNARKENADNQYRLQEAQLRGNLGEQKAAEARQTQLYKLQAEAVRRGHAGTAATQYGQVSQVNAQMANQAKRDQILATAAKEQWPYDVLIKVLDQYKTS